MYISLPLHYSRCGQLIFARATCLTLPQSSSLPVELKAHTILLQLSRSWASKLTSFQVLSALFISSLMVLCHVPSGLPLFLFLVPSIAERRVYVSICSSEGYGRMQSPLICASGECLSQAQNATLEISVGTFQPNLYMTFCFIILFL